MDPLVQLEIERMLEEERLAGTRVVAYTIITTTAFALGLILVWVWPYL